MSFSAKIYTEKLKFDTNAKVDLKPFVNSRGKNEKKSKVKTPRNIENKTNSFCKLYTYVTLLMKLLLIVAEWSNIIKNARKIKLQVKTETLPWQSREVERPDLSRPRSMIHACNQTKNACNIQARKDMCMKPSPAL